MRTHVLIVDAGIWMHAFTSALNHGSQALGCRYKFGMSPLIYAIVDVYVSDRETRDNETRKEGAHHTPTPQNGSSLLGRWRASSPKTRPPPKKLINQIPVPKTIPSHKVPIDFRWDLGLLPSNHPPYFIAFIPQIHAPHMSASTKVDALLR